MACEVAIPQLDMAPPVAITDGFYSPQHWSSSPEMSPNYANSPLASSPISCAQSPPSSYQHSPVMAAVHSPPMAAALSPAHSPLSHHGSPAHVSIKQEGDFTCAMTDSQLSAILGGKQAPPELVPIFHNVEGKLHSFLFCNDVCIMSKRSVILIKDLLEREQR